MIKFFDFENSFVHFVVKKPSNHVRVQVEAICELRNKATNESNVYYLLADCKAENTYGEDCLFLNPNYNFKAIFSKNDCILRRRYVDASDNRDTIATLDHFEDVKFDVRYLDGELLTNTNAIIDSTLNNHNLNGVVEIEENNFQAILEFPIKTINVNPKNNVYQVDTGAMLLPRFNEMSSADLDVAFVAWNKPDEAYFIIKEPVKIARKFFGSFLVNHFSKIKKYQSINKIIKKI